MLLNRIWLAALCAATLAGQAGAAEVYKIGVSAALSGYAVTLDRPWRDGLEVAVAYVNASGGIMGRQVQLVVEDNKSEPQEAVTVYRKMIGSDRVDIFMSGCFSAGNVAAAPFVVRAKIPMVLCSILPPQPDQVKWAFSTLPPPRFEVETRLDYLRSRTPIRSAGVLFDPSPYATLQKNIAVGVAPGFGIDIPVIEQHKQDDADISPQISKLNAAGLRAVVRLGIGGATITIAKNIKQLGLDMLLLGSSDDLAVYKPTGETLGDRFVFVAMPSQAYETLPDGPLRQEIARFLPLWRAKYADRDPGWGSRAWDAVMIATAAVEQAKSFEGPQVRDALETLSDFQGTGGLYHFSPTVHQGITENPFLMATMVDGKVKVRQ